MYNVNDNDFYYQMIDRAAHLLSIKRAEGDIIFFKALGDYED